MSEQKLPNYTGDSIHKIPETVANKLGIQTDRKSLVDKTNLDEYENVVLILVDGLGYKHWNKYAIQHDFFNNIERSGDLKKLTSVYPSETAAAITTLQTGLTPSKHGLTGWNMYFKEFDASIKTLPFVTQEGSNPTEEYGESFKADILFKGKSIYEDLKEQNIQSKVIIPRQMEGSEASELMFEGAEQIPYLSLADMSVKLRKTLEEANSKNYIYVYIPLLDKISHYEGTEVEEYQAQLSQISHALQENFLNKLETTKNTKLILTADHGFKDIEPEENIDILEYDEIKENLQEKRDGEKLMPTGSPRNLHLHIKEEKIEEVKNFLEHEFNCHIWTREEAIADNLFGLKYRDNFEDRIGDLIVSHKELAMWHGEEPEEIEIIGYHGGLSKDEMEVPFLEVELSELVD